MALSQLSITVKSEKSLNKNKATVVRETWKVLPLQSVHDYTGAALSVYNLD